MFTLFKWNPEYFFLASERHVEAIEDKKFQLTSIEFSFEVKETEIFLRRKVFGDVKKNQEKNRSEGRNRE